MVFLNRQIVFNECAHMLALVNMTAIENYAHLTRVLSTEKTKECKSYVLQKK